MISAVGVALATEWRMMQKEGGQNTECSMGVMVDQKDNVVWIKMSVGGIRGVDRFRVMLF